MLIKPFSTTGIGSMPHTHAEDAVELILRTFDIPFWPQLPKVSFRESMLLQYSEGMPYLKVNEKDEVAWVMRDSSDELERFYESCTDSSKISISEDYAAGLHTFLRIIKHRRFDILKGHVTGPITFTLGLKDNVGKYIFFDEELREISAMLLKAKVRWQIDVLKQHAEKVILFIDEPILSAIGSSSYLGVSTEEVLRLLQDVVGAIESAGGISAIHCCGRTDWPLALKSGIRILNFDAFEYFDTLLIYKDELNEFLRNGNYLAWGIVPTSERINDTNDEQLAILMRESMNRLAEFLPRETVRTQVLITPSCGAGSRSIAEATKICQLTMRLKEAMVSLE